MLAVPPAILDILGLQPGAKIDLAVENGRLVIQPRQRPRYRLEELLAQCDPAAKPTNEALDWTAGPAVGSELL